MQICHTNTLECIARAIHTNEEEVPDTHCSCKVAVKFFDDCSETSTCQVQKLPAPTHALSVPSRGWVLLLCGDIPFLGVEEVKLEESSELVRVCEQ